MAITIETRFGSAVVEANEDVFIGSYIEGKNTIIEFDMRKRDYRKEFGTTSDIYWNKKEYNVDMHEFSTIHNPIVCRFVLAQGYYFDDQNERIYFTPKIAGVSTCRHMSRNVIRLCCFLAVICGVSLRNIALIFSVLFQIPVTKPTIKRRIDEIGGNLLSEEEILKKLIERKEPSQCHIDGYYPLGTNRCVMVIKDESDRILITHEAASENGEDAGKFLYKVKRLGSDVTSAFSDYSESSAEAIREVFPNVRFQADHFHTTKNIWKHLKKALSEYGKNLKADGEEKKDDEMSELASALWKSGWSLSEKPSDSDIRERESIEQIEKIDGFIFRFRSVIRQIVNIFDHSNTEVQAEVKLRNLKNQIAQTENSHLAKICGFFDDHWCQAMAYLTKRGLGKHRRASNSESGMRILRRLEKNHDGIRSEITRKNYIKIYQMIKYLSTDIADFINPINMTKNKG